MFSAQGYISTTIDQIASHAGIGRRTFFRYFPNKEAVLFADFIARQKVALRLLGERAQDETPLVSLLSVFAQLCELPIDQVRRRSVRKIVQQTPSLVGIERRITVHDFEEVLVQTILDRSEDDAFSVEEIRVVTSTALACLESAWRVQMTNNRTSLAGHFTSMVQICATHWGGVGDQLPPLQG